MLIQENVSLRPYNTFGVDVNARYFSTTSSQDELLQVLKWANQTQQKILLLNGGSNILLINDWEGLALKIELKGIDIVASTEDDVIVSVQSGEDWHEFVLWCLSNDFGGLENLSLIPGKVGTAPIQNIGAYGVEVKDVMTQLTAIEMATGKIRVFSREDCQFGYRDSIFKQQLKNQYVIAEVHFRLTKKNHQLHLDYGAIRSQLSSNGIENPSIQDISQAIVSIRQSKLPDPSKIGNSGSFFKNPVISAVEFEALKVQFPQIVGHAVENKYKVAAGWLIEQAGWKGKRIGDAGVHQNQALVLVNYGHASGLEIYELSQKIMDDVWAKFGIQLEREVNIIGNSIEVNSKHLN